MIIYGLILSVSLQLSTRRCIHIFTLAAVHNSHHHNNSSFFVFTNSFANRNRYINNTVLEQIVGRNVASQLYRQCTVSGSPEVRRFWTKPEPWFSSTSTVPYCWRMVASKWARDCTQKWSKWPAGHWAYPPSWYTSKRPAPTRWPTHHQPPPASAPTSTGWPFSWVCAYTLDFSFEEEGGLIICYEGDAY